MTLPRKPRFRENRDMVAPALTHAEIDASGETSRRRALVSIFAVVVLLVPFALRLASMLSPVVDPDLWWHLAAGRWMVEHRAVPDVDPFMTGGRVYGWLDYSWFMDVLFWLGYQVAELAAPACYAVWMAGLVLLVCAALVRRDGSQLVRRSFVAALGFLAVCLHFGPRTYLFTVVFTGLTVHFIRGCLRGADPRRGYWLVPMFALWANVHIEFIYAWFFLGLATIQLWWQRSELATPARGSWKWLTLLTLACAAATLANPFGARLHAMMARMGGAYGAYDFVLEMQGNPFRSPSEYLIVALFGGAVATLAQRRDRDVYSWVALLFSAYMSFHSQRISWLLVLVALDIAGDHPLLSSESSRESVPRSFRLALPSVVALLVAICTVVLLRSRDRLVPRSTYPYGATAFAREQRLAGPLFNDWNWGGFFRFHLPEVRGNIDGRGPIIGRRADFPVATGGTWRGRPGWKENADLAGAGFVIANTRMALAELLQYDTRFRKVFADDVAAVFVREPERE